MIEPVYILIRTSNRPKFFARMMETIKEQTYKNIVTIVHTDDPRDEYVTGDIIIKGTAYPPSYGDGTYNLYNNLLLKSIPEDKPGWYHFMDDDDEYASVSAIERLVQASKKDHINVARVERIMRQGKVIFPRQWGKQKSYQTECFFLHTDHRLKAKWWGNKDGDHHYSKQLTKVLPINWIDNLLICRAQESKGHGRKLDKGESRAKINYPPDKLVPVLALKDYKIGTQANWLKFGEVKEIKYKQASEFEKNGIVKITNLITTQRERQTPPQLLNIR